MLDETAADRGWVKSEDDPDWDVVYTHANPVLGGYQHLRIDFKGNGLGEVEHVNLNRPVAFPEGGKLEDAIAVLTGEPVSATP